MLLAISFITAFCSSTAVATPIDTSDKFTINPSTSSMAAEALRESAWMVATCKAISSVALPVWLAKDFTSLATTAKPRPASPALAASMVAFNANKLVCSAISSIRRTTCWMPVALVDRVSIILTVSWVLFLAASAILVERAACSEISEMDATISSAADATPLILCEVVSTLLVTLPLWFFISDAELLNPVDAICKPSDALRTVSMVWFELVSNASINLETCSALANSPALEASRASRATLRSVALALNTARDLTISPTSSLRLVLKANSAFKSLSAKRPI